MEHTFEYDVHASRNSGYVSAASQEKFSKLRLLIAGCGIGSSPAVCAARMGFQNFVLVDGDVVEGHNLNRQFYDFDDVGKPKVDALKDKILRINPKAKVEAIRAYLDTENTDSIVARADIVFDTVDFLDLPAILGLHSSSKRHHLPIFTALSVGFGALVWYFPADSNLSLADILAPDVERASMGGVGAASYAAVFESFIAQLAAHLDAEVVAQVTKVLTMMRDGKPCPASQVAVGSFAIGAMVMSMIADMVAGNPIPEAPKLIIHSFKSHKTSVVDVSTGRAS